VDAMGGMGASAAGSGMAGRTRRIGRRNVYAGGAVGAVTNTAASTGGKRRRNFESGRQRGGSIAGASKGAVGGLNAAGQLPRTARAHSMNGLNLNAARLECDAGLGDYFRWEERYISTAGHGCCWFRRRMRAKQRRIEITRGQQPAPKSESKRKPTNPTSNKHGLFYKRPRRDQIPCGFFSLSAAAEWFERNQSFRGPLLYSRACLQTGENVSRGCHGARVPGVFCPDAAAADGPGGIPTNVPSLWKYSKSA